MILPRWCRLAPAEPDQRPLPLHRLSIAAGIILLGAVYLATLRQGQQWGDDFAMYILQARNLAAGHWSAPTGYIYNPHVPKVGPPAYPPVFPLMLAPLYRIWGLDLTPMKVEVTLCFLAALYLVFEFVAHLMPFAYAAGVTAALALAPYFVEFKDNVVSDLPFLFFAMAALCIIQACERRAWHSTALAMAAAGCVTLSFATRTAGVALIPCLLLCAVTRRRNAVLALAAALLLMAAHSLVFRGAGSYLDQLRAPWTALPHNLAAYSWSLRHGLFGIERTAPGLLVLLATVGLGAAGFAVRLRRGVGVPEAFSVTYAALVLLWSTEEDLRLLIPLLPMWGFYVAQAIRALPGRPRRAVAAALVSVLLGGYVSGYARLETGPIRDGLGDPDFNRICAYIRTNTAPNDVLVFDKARLLALATERRASPYHRPAEGAELLSYMRSISAKYVLVNRQFPDDAAYLEPLLAGHRDVYAAGPFHLYALE